MKKLILIMLALLMVPFASAIYDMGLQNQYYYIVFDEEAEASTIAIFSMNNYEDIKDMQLEIPGRDFRIVSFVQEYYDYTKECVNWDEVCTGDVCTKTCSSYQEYPRYPAKYAEVDYDTEVLSNSILLKFNIPEQDQNEIKLILYYKTESYAEKSSGIYKFDFETIKSGYDTDSVRVAVDVTNNLYLEGGQASIDYRDNVADGKVSSMEMASFVPYVQSAFVKESSVLDPLESFHVTGKYANSWFALNYWKVILGVLITGIVLCGTALGIKKGITDKTTRLSVLIGAVFGFILAGLWLGSGYLLRNINNLFGYYYNDTFSIFILLLAVLLSILLLSVPSILIGMKHGLKQGIWCLISEVITLTVLLVIGIFVFAFLFNPESPIYPTLYRGIAESVAVDTAVAQ